MKKPVKYIILGIYALLTIAYVVFVFWKHSISPLRTILAITLLVLSLVWPFPIKSNDKKPATKRERADMELSCAVVIVNRYYHYMLNAEDQEQKADYEKLYLNAVEEFKVRAEMYDAIFLTKTVLVYGKDHEDGKVIEITYDSRPA